MDEPGDASRDQPSQGELVAAMDEMRTVYMRRLALLVSAVTVVLAGACSSYKDIPRYEGPVVEEMGAVPEASVPPVYRIDYGDVLTVQSLYHEDLTSTSAVRPDGQVTVSGLGDFYAVGLTPDELEADIVRRASITHRNPVVSVLVKEYTEHRAYIGGQIRNPGFVKIRPGLTSLRAVVERGGFTHRARLDSVIHVAWDASGAYTAQRLNLEEVLETGKTEQDIFVGPNDIIYVPSTWISDAGLFTRQIIDIVPVREPVTRLDTLAF